MPWVLVGTKSDLRDEVLMDPEKGKMGDLEMMTTEEEGWAMAKGLSNRYFKGRYVKCSALTGEGIEGVLDEVSDIPHIAWG